MTNPFIELQSKRHSEYDLNDQVSQSPTQLADLIKTAIKQSPTAFNNQSTRAVITFGKDSDAVWEITLAELKQVMTDDAAIEWTAAKIDTFKAGFGTVLFYTDTDVVKEMQAQFPSYADNFPDWAEQGLGGAQQAVWEALTAEGLGASLQHYNPLIDQEIAERFDIPDSWQLRAEMPFGNVGQKAAVKDSIDDDLRFKTFGI